MKVHPDDEPRPEGGRTIPAAVDDAEDDTREPDGEITPAEVERFQDAEDGDRPKV